MRRIKQLGPVSYVFPGATHTRFEHNLGVYELTRRICDIFSKKYPSVTPGDGLWDDDNRLLVECAGLLHDIGHGPYSHTFEHLFGTNHGVGAGSLESSLYAASRMVDGSEDKLAWVSGADAVVCIAGCQKRGGKNETDTQKGEEHSFCCHSLHLIIYIHLIIYMIIYRCFFLH
mgnify:CR=1 FL=1